MTSFTRTFCIFFCVVGLLACSSRSVDTELTRCVFPDSARTPAPAFICGASVSGFPVTALRSAEPSEQNTSDRIQWVFQDQIEQWSVAWSALWFSTPEEQQRGAEFLRIWLADHARVVRSRTSPKSQLWLLIGQPLPLTELEKITKTEVQGVSS